GIFVFFITVFVMAIVLSAAGKKNEEGQGRRRRSAKVVRTLVIVIVLAVVFIGVRPIVERLSGTALESDIRPVIFKNTVELIKNYPLFGTGLATYVYAYTKYEKIYIPNLVDHAHNDYLEIVAEVGLIGGGCLIVFAFGFAVFLFLRWVKRRDYFVRGVGLGCLMGIVSILLHSLTDFNLHIPANAVYFVTLYALAFSVLNHKQKVKVR
ncbi:O-antigen ligase family protein, partial [Acidobacteriota bacterium]